MSHKIILSKEDISEHYFNTRNNLSQAANILGCSVTVLRRWIFAYGLKPKTKTWNEEAFIDNRFVQPAKELISHEEIKRVYLDQKVNMPQAARLLGCSVEFLRRSMKVLNISTKPKSWNPERKRKVPLLNDKEWLQKELATKTMCAVAKSLGSTEGNVLYYARKHGLVEKNELASKNIKEALLKKYPNGRFGALSSNWRGGRRSAGKSGTYIYVYSPDHKFASSEGYVMEHRLVMQKKLGRLLTPGEVVHHINGNKRDNRPENLELMDSRGEHTREHYDRSFRTEQAEEETNRLKKLLADNNIPF